MLGGAGSCASADGEETDAADQVPLPLGQLAGHDRDEDDVVDAEDDLQGRQREQGDPRLGVREDLHMASIGSGGSVGVGRSGAAASLA